MAYRRVPFQEDEWFHCYNRGIDRRIVFESEDDAERFLRLLYVANSEDPIHMADVSAGLDQLLAKPRGSPLTAIGAYCLMPNHFHLLLKEITEGGITKFMQKLGTAYTMYFNTRNDRTGNLFIKPFRSRHVNDDRYFQHVINYIHCNRAELIDPGWKKGTVRNLKRVERELLGYRYSSFPDYAGIKRPHAAILSDHAFDVYRRVPPEKMIREAAAYYAEHPDEN